MNHAIRVENLSFGFKVNGKVSNLLLDISFKINKGQTVALLGPSGSGKTTLLKLLFGLYSPTHGSINCEVGKKSVRWGYVPQSPTLIPWYTLKKNAELSSSLIGAIPNHLNIDSLIEAFELLEYAGYYPSDLSGGMQQRVSIIRSIAHSPDFILFDEPFANLDDALRQRLILIIQEYQEKIGFGSLLVTHDHNEAIQLANEIIILSRQPARVIEKIQINSSFKQRQNNDPIALEEMRCAEQQIKLLTGSLR